jgi:hypothetical protein
MKAEFEMKKLPLSLLLFCALTFAGTALYTVSCTAQAVTASVGVNIADQPVWGPSGYDRADYYYIPDINSYYSVSEHQYIYKDGSDWKHAAALPASYNYDPYHSYKVVVNQDKPYLNNDKHVAQYSKFKGITDQPVNRDSKDPRYFENKDHPEHANWKQDPQK